MLKYLVTTLSRLTLVTLLLSLPAFAQTPGAIDAQQFQKKVAHLEQLIELVEELTGVLESATLVDDEALFYRRDELGIQALTLMDEMSRTVSKLEPDNELRLAVEQQLRDGLMGVDMMLSQRIEELNERIVASQQRAEAAGGPAKVAEQAYNRSLRNLRIRYFGAVVALIESRKELGLPLGDLEARAQAVLRRHAERSVATLELVTAGLKNIDSRLALDRSNADLKAASDQARLAHDFYLEVLRSLVGLMDRLGLDTAIYRTVVVRESSVVSVGLFDRGVLPQIWQETMDWLRDVLSKNAPDILFQVLVFALILLAFRALARFVRGAVKMAIDRSHSEMSTLLQDILISASGGTIMLFGFLVALSQVGISLGPMLAGLGVAGFIVGFALQDTLGNFAAGGMILIYRPYDVDDYVEVTGVAGLVKKMTLVSTTILTFDNQTLVIPNSKIWGDVIKNVTAQHVRRVDMEFGIGYDCDIEHAERVLRDIVTEHEKTLAQPEPQIRVHRLGDSSVDLIVRPWVKTEDYWTVYWDITREVKFRFDKEGITIPFPQRDVHIYSDKA